MNKNHLYHLQNKNIPRYNITQPFLTYNRNQKNRINSLEQKINNVIKNMTNLQRQMNTLNQTQSEYEIIQKEYNMVVDAILNDI